MARRYQQQPSFEGIGDDTYSGAQKALQSAIARDPNAYAYSYGELDKKYPVAATRPIAPAWIQDEIDEQELQRKSAEIAYKEKQYRMQLMDSQLNRENARLTQAPLLRKELAKLNPQSDDFQQKYFEVAEKYPMAIESEEVRKVFVEPLMNTHNQYINNKNYMERLNQRPMSVTEMDKANNLYFDLSTMKAAGEPMSQAQEDMLLNLESRMSSSGSTRQPSTQSQQQVVNPQTQQRNYSPKQQEALQWIQQNPNDPRAELIKRKLGI